MTCPESIKGGVLEQCCASMGALIRSEQSMVATICEKRGEKKGGGKEDRKKNKKEDGESQALCESCRLGNIRTSLGRNKSRVDPVRVGQR
jgi:hypothetical protein